MIVTPLILIALQKYYRLIDSIEFSSLLPMDILLLSKRCSSAWVQTRAPIHFRTHANHVSSESDQERKFAMKLKILLFVIMAFVPTLIHPASAQEKEVRYQLIETGFGFWRLCEYGVSVCQPIPIGYSVLPFSFTASGNALICRSAGGFVDLNQCIPVTTAINFAPVREDFQK